MVVREMIDKLKMWQTIEIRDSENCRICVVYSISDGIKPYLEKEVTSWFPTNGDIPSLKNINLVLYVND